MATVVRLERWSDRESNAGVREAFCPAVDIIDAERYVELNGREELSLSLDPNHAWFTALTVRKVIRVVYSDDEYEEWRVARFSRKRSQDGRLTFDVFCRSMRSVLADDLLRWPQADGTVFLHHELADLTAEEFLDHLITLDSWPADFTKGTVDGTPERTMVIDWMTAEAALLQVAVDTGLDLEVRRNGTSGYIVDMTEDLRATETANIRFAANMLEAEVGYEFEESGSVIYPRGEGPQGQAPTIADLRWKAAVPVSEPSDTWLLYAWNGNEAVAGSLLLEAENDQLVGLYLEAADGTLYEILDSSYGFVIHGSDAGFRLTVEIDATVSGLGDGLCYIRANAAGDELTYLPVPSAISSYGTKGVILDRPDIPGVTNLCARPFVSDHGTEGTDWDKIGSAVITTISAPDERIHYGTSAVKVSANIGWGYRKYIAADPAIYGHLVTERKPYLSFQSWGWLEAGAVKMEVRFVFSGDDELVLPFGVDLEGEPIEAKTLAAPAPYHLILEPQTYAWHDVFVERGTPTAISFDMVALEDATVFYADAFQVVNEAVYAQKIVSGSSAAMLWDAGMRAILFDGIAQPSATLLTTLLDLTRLDPTTYPYDEINTGVTLTVTDPGLSLAESRRVFAVRQNLLAEALTSVELEEA